MDRRKNNRSAGKTSKLGSLLGLGSGSGLKKMNNSRGAYKCGTCGATFNRRDDVYPDRFSRTGWTCRRCAREDMN